MKGLHYIKKIFVVDLIGALVSVLMLGFMLVKFNEFIGLPTNDLYILASVPCIFVVYDLVILLFVQDSFRKYLLIIAMLNWAYCLFSIFVILRHAAHLTTWGWIYFVGEIIIVALIGLWEWQNAKNIKS